jgi:hypothetical protein
MELSSVKTWLEKLLGLKKFFSGAGIPNRAKGHNFHHARGWSTARIYVYQKSRFGILIPVKGEQEPVARIPGYPRVLISIS